MTNVQAQPKAKTFFGITAKDFIALAQMERDAAKLAERLAWANRRVADHTAKGATSKAKRWERVARIVSERILAVTGGSATPNLAPNALVTFTAKPLAKGKRKAARKAQPKAVGGIEAAISASGMTREELLLALARA